jgi:hypothetical protein
MFKECMDYVMKYIAGIFPPTHPSTYEITIPRNVHVA